MDPGSKGVIYYSASVSTVIAKKKQYTEFSSPPPSYFSNKNLLTDKEGIKYGIYPQNTPGYCKWSPIQISQASNKKLV